MNSIVTKTHMFPLLFMAGLVTSCSALPQLAQTADDIFTDNAVTISVQKEAMQKETDLDINVKIVNKDQPKK